MAINKTLLRDSVRQELGANAIQLDIQDENALVEVASWASMWDEPRLRQARFNVACIVIAAVIGVKFQPVVQK
jgi:hypothetical protein